MRTLREVVEEFARDLSYPPYEEWIKESGLEDERTGNEFYASDFLEEALCIRYIFDEDFNFVGGQVLFNSERGRIWIDTEYMTVEGFSNGEDSYKTGFIDTLDIHGELEEWSIRSLQRRFR